MKHHIYENKKQPLASVKVFYGRVFRNFAIAFAVLLFCLLIGVFGYHYFDDIKWIDAVHNASMILGGMGPVVEIKSFGGKVFSSAYAIFCGVALLTNIGFILTPAVHRLFHRLHLDEVKDHRGS